MQEHEEEDDVWCHFPVSGIVLLYILMFVNKLMDVSLPQRLECVC